VTIDTDGGIISFVEKQAKPETTLMGICIYILARRTLKRLGEYLTEASDSEGRDSQGRFKGWLHKREPAYDNVLDGHWWDVGTTDQHNEANETLLSLRNRLPPYPLLT